MITVSTFTSVINQLLPEPHAGLLSGILFGVKASLDPMLYDALIKTGTLHIVALSGMNITILTGLVGGSLLWFFSRKIATFATIGVIVGFILFVGPSASVVRAGIMGGISGIAILFGKRAWALWSWGIAVVLMLVAKPLWITDLSFQLSVLASLGMIVFGKNNLEGRVWKTGSVFYPQLRSSSIYPFFQMLHNGLHETLAAQSLTIPLLLFSFGRLSFISPLTNVLIVWTLPTITVLGLFVCITGYFFLPIGQVFAWGCWIFLEYTIQVITWTSKVPFVSVGV